MGDEDRRHPVVVLTEGTVFGSYGDRRSRSKDFEPIARPGIDRTQEKGSMSSEVVTRRKPRRGDEETREANAMSDHVAINIVSELFDDELDDIDSGNEDSFPPSSPLSRTFTQPWSWSDADSQHIAATAAASYETPLGSISSFGSISSADSALIERSRTNPWHAPAPRPPILSESEKSSLSAGSSPPPPHPATPQSQKDDNSTQNRHSYPKATSGGPTKKQPLLATPVIHNGKVSREPPRFYQSGASMSTSGTVSPATSYKPASAYSSSSLRYGRGGGYSGTSGTSPANWQYTIHEDQARTNYGGNGGVMLRFNDRQNRPPRLANKSRRFSDGILYTGQQQEGSESLPPPPPPPSEVHPGPPPPSYAPPPCPMQHLYPGMVRGVKLRKGGSAQVGRSHSFNHSPRLRPHLTVPRSSTPGSSPPMHHDQRMQLQHPSFSLRLGYHKAFRPHSAPNPFLTPNGVLHPQYDSSVRPKASHELHIRIELCVEETKILHAERRRVEIELTNQGYLSGRNSYTPIASSIPRLPPNPTRLDKLVNDQFKEHAKMDAFISLLERHHLLHAGGEVTAALDNWLLAIRELYMKRQEERETLSDPSRRNQWDENEVLGLAACAEDLTGAILDCRMVIGSFFSSGDASVQSRSSDLEQVEHSFAAFRLPPEGGHTV